MNNSNASANVSNFQFFTGNRPLEALQQRGLEILIQARGAYQNLSLAGVPLRLYAVTWQLLRE